MAIQDAVSTANRIAAPLRRGRTPSSLLLASIQLRRQLPAASIQAIQLFLQRLVIAPALAASGDIQPVALPAALRFALRFQSVRAVPARVFGLGPWREHVRKAV